MCFVPKSYSMKTPLYLMVFTFAIVVCCKPKQKEVDDVKNKTTILEKVDLVQKDIEKEMEVYAVIASLDHHRMAMESGVYTPPAILNIYSSPEINTALIARNQLIGLDLPYKILCYSEPDTTAVSLAYTSPEFISKRQGVALSDLDAYKAGMDQLINSVGAQMLSPSDIQGVEKGFGIIQIGSDYDFETTVTNLRAIVAAQSDTRWFGEVDYKKDGLDKNPDLRPTILLLFGGPAPGGKAMVTTPKIGLDAFCQKLLVYEDEDGKVWVAFNDIAAFAELYYGASTKPQNGINNRLKMTFSKAVQKQAN